MDPVKCNILEAALAEFAQYGYEGTRIESVAARTSTSKRMIYYHFGGKERLYAETLEYGYRQLRDDRAMAELGTMPPMEALTTMAGDAFDRFSAHPNVMRVILQENLQGSGFVKNIPAVVQTNLANLAVVEDVLRRGQAEGSMRQDTTAMHVYINFVGLCSYHMSARNNYRVLFNYDTAEPAIAASRRASICDSIVRYVRA